MTLSQQTYYGPGHLGDLQPVMYHKFPITYEPRCEKTGLRGFPTRYDTNRAAHVQKMVKGLKIWIQKVEGLYYP